MSEPTSQRLALDFRPFPHQRQAHARRLQVRFGVLVWHRRAGKTVFAVVELLLAALCCPLPRGRYGYLAPYLKQAKLAAWDYLRHYGSLIPGASINETELSLTLPNGAQVRLYGADNPDSLRGGYLDGVVLDEVADMRPQVWGEVVRPMLADRRGWALFIGTPKGLNLFSEIFYAAQRDPGWFTDVRRAQDTGVIAAEELEEMRRTLTPAQWAQEMEVDFAAAVDDVLLRVGDVPEAQQRVLAERDYIDSPKVLGVDVARYGDDSTVLFPRQGLVGFNPQVLQGASTMEVADAVAATAARWGPDAVFVDVGGVGAGVFDRLVQLGLAPIPVDFGSRALESERFENKRAEMWWALAEWIRGGACLPSTPRLQADLTAPRMTYRNARGRMQLEGKEDMRARGLPSTDYGDALACTFAFPVASRGWESRSGTKVATEYDPYA